MLDVAWNSPPEVKIPTPTIIVEKNKTYTSTYVYIVLNKRIEPITFKNPPT